MQFDDCFRQGPSFNPAQRIKRNVLFVFSVEEIRCRLSSSQFGSLFSFFNCIFNSPHWFMTYLLFRQRPNDEGRRKIEKGVGKTKHSDDNTTTNPSSKTESTDKDLILSPSCQAIQQLVKAQLNKVNRVESNERWTSFTIDDGRSHCASTWVWTVSNGFRTSCPTWPPATWFWWASSFGKR